MADECGLSINEYDIPPQLCATGPNELVPGVTMDSYARFVKDVHYIGAVEGFIAGQSAEAGEYSTLLDDEEYPANRSIVRASCGTLVLEGRFGRDKRFVLAVNRASDLAAKVYVEQWLDHETGMEGSR